MRLADLAGAKEGQGTARSIGKQARIVRGRVWARIAPGSGSISAFFYQFWKFPNDWKTPEMPAFRVMPLTWRSGANNWTRAAVEAIESDRSPSRWLSEKYLFQASAHRTAL
jgi:hypothetical protein